MSVKTCSKCGEAKALDLFHKRKRSADGRRGICKKCESPLRRKASRKYATERSDRRRESQRVWAKNNRAKVNACKRAHLLRNPEAMAKQVEAAKKAGLKGIERLSDWYVRSVLSHRGMLKRGDIPQPLIEAKRVQLQIKRFLKEQTK